MRKLLAFLICSVVACSSQSSSSSGSESEEVIEINSPAVMAETGAALNEQVGMRHAASLVRLNPRLARTPAILKSQTVDAVHEAKPEPRPILRQSSFVALVSIPRASHRDIKHPRTSAILKELSVLDELMATQFPLADKPKSIMAGHLKAQKSFCRRFLGLYGPLHPFYRNCAFRGVELDAFLHLLTKYNTEIDIEVVSRGAHLRSSFCKSLASNLKRLSSLVGTASRDFNPRLEYSKKDAFFIISAIRPFANELKELEEFVDTVDWNLAEFCGAGSVTNESIEVVKETLAYYLKLAF